MKQSTLSKISAQLVEKLAQLARQARALVGAALSVFPNHIFTSHAQGEQTDHASDQRQHPRVALHNTTVHVTDGCLFATALLENISPSGLCICNLPEQLYKNAGKLTVFSSDDPGLPVLQIEPRWQKTNWRGKTIGAVILNATDAWRLFFVHTAGQFT